MSEENNEFFEDQLEQSYVKSKIVSKYFWSWLKIMEKNADEKSKLGYIDLYVGPGEYDDGSESTPMIIMNNIRKEKLVERFKLFMNDKKKENATSMVNLIKTKYPEFKTNTKIYNCDTEEIWDILVRQMSNGKGGIIPSFVFLDPFGYKGITLDLLKSVTMSWGCDAVLFFNFNRVNMALGNSMIQKTMKKLWGDEEIVKKLNESKNPEDRERAVVDALKQIIKDSGVDFVLDFRFKRKGYDRTSHYLIFMTKHPLALKLMKDIMAKMSEDEEGFGTFEFDGSDQSKKKKPLLQVDLFGTVDVRTNAEKLTDRIISFLSEMKEESISFIDMFYEDSTDTKFTSKNYKDVVKSLESDGRILVTDPRQPPRKRLPDTLPDDFLISLVRKEK